MGDDVMIGLGSHWDHTLSFDYLVEERWKWNPKGRDPSCGKALASPAGLVALGSFQLLLVVRDFQNT